MHFPALLPSDGVIAALLGIAPYWDQIVPYLDLLGYLAWYGAGAVFMLLAMVFRRGPFITPLIAAFGTGVLVKLADVYSWGRLAYFEQILAFAVVVVLVGTFRAILHRRRHGIVFSK
jgi:F0F1-type ATP synthase assembly protein I